MCVCVCMVVLSDAGAPALVVRERLKPQKDEDEDSQEETTEEKVKAGAVAWLGLLVLRVNSLPRQAILRFYRPTLWPSCRSDKGCSEPPVRKEHKSFWRVLQQRIPLAFLAAVILGIWTPGTDVEIGVGALPVNALLCAAQNGCQSVN